MECSICNEEVVIKTMLNPERMKISSNGEIPNPLPKPYVQILHCTGCQKEVVLTDKNTPKCIVDMSGESWS